MSRTDRVHRLARSPLWLHRGPVLSRHLAEWWAFGTSIGDIEAALGSRLTEAELAERIRWCLQHPASCWTQAHPVDRVTK